MPVIQHNCSMFDAADRSDAREKLWIATRINRRQLFPRFFGLAPDRQSLFIDRWHAAQRRGGHHLQTVPFETEMNLRL